MQESRPHLLVLMNRWVGLAGIAVLAAAMATETYAADASAVEASHLDVVLENIRSEVELLRYHMGKPENRQSPPPVDDVQAHEALLQAQNLFRKTNRLARELVGVERRGAPAPSTDAVGLEDVLAPLEAALGQIQDIKSALGIDAQAEAPQRGDSRDLTAVYRTIVQTNRQLNLMMEESYSARDVYEQISLAITYAAGMLAAYPDSANIPEAPPWEAGKTPADVYALLAECLRLNRSIADSVEFRLLRFDPRNIRRGDVLTSDVYDMATLLVSYVGSLASSLDAPEVYPELAEPDYVFPAHAYQHASTLHRQLTAIEALVAD